MSRAQGSSENGVSLGLALLMRVLKPYSIVIEQLVVCVAVFSLMIGLPAFISTHATLHKPL